MNTDCNEESQATADIMNRFNDVFQRHDPSALRELVAEAPCQTVRAGRPRSRGSRPRQVQSARTPK
jgi:hypothetical protein